MLPEVVDYTGGQFALQRNQVALSLAPTKEEMVLAEALWDDLLRKASDRSFTSDAKDTYGALKEREPRIKELTDRLSMIRAFPGECEFCPLRSTRKRRNKRRGG